MLSAGFVHFAEYELQIIALAWLAVMYVIKSYQLSHLAMPWEKAPGKGNSLAGVMRTYAGIFMPWTMESSRKHLRRWVEFGAYHVGAFIAILTTFTMPFVPAMMTGPVRLVFTVLIAPAVVLSLVKLVRRLKSPELRVISTPDDYFALVSVGAYFISAVVALLMDTPLARTVYFIITAAFLFYVPFSKISHYVYFLFAGMITGSRYGWRGVRPQVRRAQ
jgi:nitrate reductase gamma subunit